MVRPHICLMCLWVLSACGLARLHLRLDKFIFVYAHLVCGFGYIVALTSVILKSLRSASVLQSFNLFSLNQQQDDELISKH